jgi:hypothetical protein
MKKLLTILFVLAGLCACGQAYVPFANSVNKKDTAYTTLSLRVDSALRLPRYANTDTTKVLSLDAGGNLVWRTKGTALSLTSANIFVGNSSNVATAVTMSGDASISNTGALTLATSGVTAGTYAYITVDAKGRATSAIPIAYQTLTDGSTITWTVSNGTNAIVTLGGNRTLAFSGAVAGEYLTLEVIQDGTGSRTLTYPGNVKWSGGSAPVLTTTAGAKDVLCFAYDGTNYIGTQPGVNVQ